MNVRPCHSHCYQLILVIVAVSMMCVISAHPLIAEDDMESVYSTGSNEVDYQHQPLLFKDKRPFCNAFAGKLIEW